MDKFKISKVWIIICIFGILLSTAMYIIVIKVLINDDTNENYNQVIKLNEDTELKLDEALSILSEEDKPFGYLARDIYSADLDDDGYDEIYANAVYGSGVLRYYIESYNMKTNKLYTIEDTNKFGYQLIVFDDMLYAVTVISPLSSYYEPAKIYQLSLVNNSLELIQVNGDIANMIIEQINIEELLLYPRIPE